MDLVEVQESSRNRRAIAGTVSTPPRLAALFENPIARKSRDSRGQAAVRNRSLVALPQTIKQPNRDVYAEEGKIRGRFLNHAGRPTTSTEVASDGSSALKHAASVNACHEQFV